MTCISRHGFGYKISTAIDTFDKNNTNAIETLAQECTKKVTNSKEHFYFNADFSGVNYQNLQSDNSAEIHSQDDNENNSRNNFMEPSENTIFEILKDGETTSRKSNNSVTGVGDRISIIGLRTINFILAKFE